MNPILQITPATSADAPLLAELSARTFQEAFGEQNSPENMRQYIESHFTEEKLAQELADTHVTLLLARIGDEAVGYAKIRTGTPPAALSYKTSAEIERLYVVKEKIGTGVGRRLLDAAIDLAIDKGIPVIWLGVWENNTKAITFYRRFGFEQFGTQPFQLGNDTQTDLLLQKVLV